jgi:hypothetical protein
MSEQLNLPSGRGRPERLFVAFAAAATAAMAGSDPWGSNVR